MCFGLVGLVVWWIWCVESPVVKHFCCYSPIAASNLVNTKRFVNLSKQEKKPECAVLVCVIGLELMHLALVLIYAIAMVSATSRSSCTNNKPAFH